MNAQDRQRSDTVGDAIRGTAEALGPWVAQHVGVWPPDRRGRISPHDPSYLVSVILDHWMGTFQAALGEDNLGLVHKYRDLRNRWAHNETFDANDVAEAQRVAHRLLSVVGGTYAEAAPAHPAPDAAPGPNGHRKARSSEFRREQWEQRFAPHVAPVNHLVDALIVERPGSWMPYVAPYHGGTEAEILLLYQDPGPMTATTNGGSGFIGCENDDPSAELLAQCLESARVIQHQVVPWNAYPWFRRDQSGTLPVGLIKEGLLPLARLLDLLPAAHTVVTGGKKAHDSWNRLAKSQPSVVAKYRHLETFHTSRRGITNGGQQSRDAGIAHVVETLRHAAQHDGS